jgi:hypothetical protein
MHILRKFNTADINSKLHIVAMFLIVNLEKCIKQLYNM